MPELLPGFDHFIAHLSKHSNSCKLPALTITANIYIYM